MPTPPDSYAALYLREVGEIVRSIDPGRRGRAGERARGCSAPSRSALRPRSRRRRGPRVARRQRLPEALRLRGVCADRQRRRDHGANERRGMGDELRRVATDLAPLVAGRAARVLRRRRKPRAQRLGEPGSRDRARARRSAHASSASSVEATAPPPRKPTSASSSTHRRSGARPTSRSSRRSSGISSSPIPALGTAPGKWESVEVTGGR